MFSVPQFQLNSFTNGQIDYICVLSPAISGYNVIFCNLGVKSSDLSWEFPPNHYIPNELSNMYRNDRAFKDF